MINRLRLLEEFRRAADRLSDEIFFLGTPIERILQSLSAEKHSGRYYSMCCENIEQSFEKSWKISVESAGRDFKLNEEEKSTLLVLDSIGRTDKQGIERLISCFRNQLEQHISARKEEVLTKGKMALSCSLLAGIGAVIMII